MRYTYSSLYHVCGLSPASRPEDEEIFSDSAQGRAVLTSDPSRACDQLDHSAALASMLLTGLIGGQKESGAIDERLANQVHRLCDERAKKFPAGVFLFFEASGRCTSITPQVERDCGSFVLALDGLPKGEIRNQHEPLVKKILVAISLGFASVAGFEKIADATVFLTEEGKPVRL